MTPDGTISCSGVGTFNVGVGMTAMVAKSTSLSRGARKGVLVNGAEHLPGHRFDRREPTSAIVGTGVSLTSAAHDRTAAPRR
jgi:hypothetical protein